MCRTCARLRLWRKYVRTNDDLAVFGGFGGGEHGSYDMDDSDMNGLSREVFNRVRRY